MTSSLLSAAEVHREFARRRTRQLIALVPVLIAIALLFWFDRHRGASIAGINPDAMPIVPFAFVAGVVLFSLFNWRCPACSGHLGRGWNPRYCPKCGASLRP